MDHRELIETTLRFWRVHDVEQTLVTIADDIVYQIYTAQSATPLSGQTSGKEAFGDFLYELLAHFDYLSYEPTILEVHDGVARIQTQYVLRHRASGETLEGSKRSVCTITNDLIARIDEYHDAALVEAFMRLTKAKDGEQHAIDVQRARALKL